MQTKFVRVLCDVRCEWDGDNPQYRVFVNQELFTERTWVWDSNRYLEEAIQLDAPLGRYKIRYELVPPTTSVIEMTNIRIDFGTARILRNNTVEIY